MLELNFVDDNYYANRRRGIKISSHNTNIVIKDSVIAHLHKNGVEVEGINQSIFFISNEITDNGWNGLYLSSTAKITMRDNKIINNGLVNNENSYYGIHREQSDKNKRCPDSVVNSLNSLNNQNNYYDIDYLCVDADSDNDGWHDAIDNEPLMFSEANLSYSPTPNFIGLSSRVPSTYAKYQQASSQLTFYSKKPSEGINDATEGVVIYGEEVQLYVPQGALHSNNRLLDFSISPSLNRLEGKYAKVFEFYVSNGGYDFSKPIHMTFKIPSETPIQYLPYYTVSVYNENRKTWENYGGKVDLSNYTITATIPHFTEAKYDCVFCEVVIDEVEKLSINGLKVLFEDVWNSLLVNTSYATERLESYTNGDRSLLDDLLFAVENCSDIQPYIRKYLGNIDDDHAHSAATDLATVTSSWALRCESSLGGPPSYKQVSFSAGVEATTRRALQRSITTMWSRKVSHKNAYHDAMITCEDVIARDDSHSGTGREHCEANDSMLFTSISLLASRNDQLEKGIHNSMDGDGRLWRSAENRKKPRNNYKDFSKDHTLGFFLYLAATNDVERGERLLNYLYENGNYVCPYSGSKEAISHCFVTAGLSRLLYDFMIKNGRDHLVPAVSGVELNVYEEIDQDSIKRGLKGYELHLKLIKILTAARLGKLTDKSIATARLLHEKNPDNLFFQYVYKLTNPSAPLTFDGIGRRLLQYMDSWNSAGYQDKKKQWTWERNPIEESEDPHEISMGWEYLVLAGLLDAKINIYKDEQDFGQLNLPPLGLYMINGLSGVHYLLHYPGDPNLKNYEHRYCTLNYTDLDLALIKGWQFGSNTYNSGLSYFYDDKYNTFTGTCAPPIISERASSDNRLFRNKKTLTGHSTRGSIIKTVNFPATVPCGIGESCEVDQFTCQSFCMLDRQCKAVNLYYDSDTKNYRCEMVEATSTLMPTPSLAIYTAKKYDKDPDVKSHVNIGCESSKTTWDGKTDSCNVYRCFQASDPLGYLDLGRSVASLRESDKQGGESFCNLYENKSLVHEWTTEICIHAHGKSHDANNGKAGKINCSFEIYNYK